MGRKGYGRREGVSAEERIGRMGDEMRGKDKREMRKGQNEDGSEARMWVRGMECDTQSVLRWCGFS